MINDILGYGFGDSVLIETWGDLFVIIKWLPSCFFLAFIIMGNIAVTRGMRPAGKDAHDNKIVLVVLVFSFSAGRSCLTVHLV